MDSGRKLLYFVATREANTEQQYQPLQKEGEELKEVQTKGVQEEWERRGRR